jgi:catechol 2,3-dioxygenase-like lactoylglutathione lyase family enzyme
MIGYVTIGTNDFERAASFYDALLAPLGMKRLMQTPRVIHYGKPGKLGTLAVIKPYDGESATVGNGVMVALATRKQQTVDEAYALALSLGAGDEGAPGIRSDNFYGAYFRDLDGNKLCVYSLLGPINEGGIRKLHKTQ